MHTNATPEALFGEVCALGGNRGWLVGTWLWALRGWLDRMVGGVGMRRGRRHRTDLRVGDVVDFWRVEAPEPGRLLRLRAVMRVPGDAWLEWLITPEPDGVLFVQRAVFHPRGLFGRVYWYSVAPFQRFMFGRLALGIEQHAAKALTGFVERAA